MAITAGSDILAADFIDTSAGAGDSGKAVKVDGNGKIDHSFQKAPIIKTMTAGATISGATLPVPVYQNAADSEMYACDGNDTSAVNFVGFAITDGTDGNNIDIQFEGVVSGFSGLTVGARYYVQDTVGTIGITQGTQSILVGKAVSATEILITKHPLNSAGVVADLSSTATGSSNNDVTVTTGFKPSKIILHYYVQGYIGGNAYQKIGIAVFEATTLKFNNLLNTGASSSSDNAVETLETNLPNDTAAISVGVEDATGANQKIAINSVSETGFVIRRLRSDGSGTGLTSRVKIAYEVFE